MSLADKLSALRIILVPVFVACLLYARGNPAFKNAAIAVFFIAALSDLFDGLVARIRKEKSNIGQVIDPLADKLLLLTSFFSLYALRNSLPLEYKMPLGIVLVVVSRDLIILLGLITLNFLKKDVSIAPSIWGKLTTFSQVTTILSLLLNMPFFPIVWKIAAVFTTISGVDYFVRGVKSANDKNHNIVNS